LYESVVTHVPKDQVMLLLTVLDVAQKQEVNEIVLRLTDLC
jgi:hypothetical protein